MCISSLHQNQRNILAAFRSALRILRMAEHLAIIGSLALYLKPLNPGQNARLPGDIDVFIEGPLCERYWEFLEILTLYGIRSVRDVLDRPAFNWNPCHPGTIAHARALTIDCNATTEPDKSGAIDICFRASDLAHIPNTNQWVESLDMTLMGPARQRAIEDGHRRLLNELQSREKFLSSPVFSSEAGLYYRLAAV